MPAFNRYQNAHRDEVIAEWKAAGREYEPDDVTRKLAEMWAEARQPEGAGHEEYVSLMAEWAEDRKQFEQEHPWAVHRRGRDKMPRKRRGERLSAGQNVTQKDVDKVSERDGALSDEERERVHASQLERFEEGLTRAGVQPETQAAVVMCPIDLAQSASLPRFRTVYLPVKKEETIGDLLVKLNESVADHNFQRLLLDGNAILCAHESPAMSCVGKGVLTATEE
jgi:hypothetical protein